MEPPVAPSETEGLMHVCTELAVFVILESVCNVTAGSVQDTEADG